MAFDYTETETAALELLTDFGRAVTVVQINRTPANATLPWKGSTAGTNTETSATAVFCDPVSEKDLGHEESRGPDDSIVRATQIAFIAYSENDGVDFTNYDRILDHGQTWTILHCSLLQPGGTPLLWQLEVVR